MFSSHTLYCDLGNKVKDQILIFSNLLQMIFLADTKNLITLRNLLTVFIFISLWTHREDTCCVSMDHTQVTLSQRSKPSVYTDVFKILSHSYLHISNSSKRKTKLALLSPYDKKIREKKSPLFYCLSVPFSNGDIYTLSRRTWPRLFIISPLNL